MDSDLSDPFDPLDAPDRFWPDRGRPDAQASVFCLCPDCELRWQIHRDMCGSRLRCDCGAWIDVPADEPVGALEIAEVEDPAEASSLLVPTEEPGVLAPVDAASGLEHMEADTSSWQGQGEQRDREVALNAPVRAGALKDASHETRVKWTNRSFLEIGCVFVALVIPPTVISLLVPAHNQALYMPLTSFVGGLLVLLAGMLAGHYAFGALRRCSFRYFFEAVLVGGAFFTIAYFYTDLVREALAGEDAVDPLSGLRDQLGLGWALFVVALCPAIFEELAFRGMLQGRLSALYGRKMGLSMTAVMFALAHGVTLGFPFHVGIGFYLCSLRSRCGSLYPGIVMHFLYNGALIATI